MGAAVLPIADRNATCRKDPEPGKQAIPQQAVIAPRQNSNRLRGISNPFKRRSTSRESVVARFEKALESRVVTDCSPSTTQARPRRRRKCSTAPNVFTMAQRSGAPSVTESLVSSGTTPAELASVQRSALLASRPARRATADGYADLRRPDQALQAHEEELEPSVVSLMRASVEEKAI
jgi:hypothetical protein